MKGPFERLAANLVRLPRPVFIAAMTLFAILTIVPPFVVVAVLLRHADIALSGNPIRSSPLAAQIFLTVFLTPPLETALFQMLPIAIARRLRWPDRTAGLLSAAVFGCVHAFNAVYVLQMLFLGLFLAWTYFLAERRNESSFVDVALVHMLWNLGVIVMHSLV